MSFSNQMKHLETGAQGGCAQWGGKSPGYPPRGLGKEMEEIVRPRSSCLPCEGPPGDPLHISPPAQGVRRPGALRSRGWGGVGRWVRSGSSDYVMQCSYRGIGEAVLGTCRTESMVINSEGAFCCDGEIFRVQQYRDAAQAPAAATLTSTSSFFPTCCPVERPWRSQECGERLQPLLTDGLGRPRTLGSRAPAESALHTNTGALGSAPGRAGEG